MKNYSTENAAALSIERDYCLFVGNVDPTFLIPYHGFANQHHPVAVAVSFAAGSLRCLGRTGHVYPRTSCYRVNCEGT